MANNDEERLVVLLEARIKDLEKNMAKASKTTERRFNEMKRDSRSATRAMERDMNRSTSRINQALASTTGKIGALSKAFAVGLVGGSLAGFTHEVRKVVGEMSELAKAADRVGLSTKAFQELQFGFGLAGVEISTFNTGMEQFTRRIAEAEAKGGTLADILEANSVALRDQNGHMRSAEDLLADYADLMRNAASEQERMLLATEAFGRGGAAFVLALRHGREGIYAMKVATEKAGGVVDEQLLRRAEELDDRFASLSRTISIEFKSALLSVALAGEEAFDRIGKALERNKFAQTIRELDRQRAEAAAGAVIGALAGKKITITEPVDPAEQARIQSRIDGALSAPTGEKTTKIPSTSRNEETARTLAEANAVLTLIENLKAERDLIGASNVERAKAGALRQAGSAATEDQRQAIIALVEEIDRETQAVEKNWEAQEARAEALEYGFNTIGDAILDIAGNTDNASDSIKRLAAELAFAAAQAALLGSGPLAGLFGSSGGILGSVNSSATGIRIPGNANGTDYWRGGLTWVGERGPELVNLPRGAQVIPNHRIATANGNTRAASNQNFAPTYNISISGDGMSAEEVARHTVEAIREYDRERAPQTVLETMREAQQAGVQ